MELDTGLKMPSERKGYPWFFFFRIARLALIVFLPTLFLMLFFYRSSYKEGLINQMTIQIKENLQTTKFTVENGKMDWMLWCKNLVPDPDARYSLINREGLILCDSEQSKINKPVNDKTEIEASFDHGFETAIRKSDFFNTQSVFAAIKLNENLVLRKVTPISSMRDNMGRFDRILFFRIVPFGLLSYLIFLLFFYQATRPLGAILAKVEKYKEDIPFNQSINLHYKKNEWAQVEEALNKADQRIKDQVSQVKSENDKIAAILESIYDDIIAIDNFETVLFYNSNFKKNFMREKNVGEILPKLWHTFNDEETLEAFRKVLKDGNTISLKGLNFLSYLRPESYCDLTVTPLKNPEGKITGALGVLYDVTDFKLTEQMRVDFVANVSHEIRTPLTSIKGYTQIIQNNSDRIPVELHAFLEKILSNTERMISLFSDLLNLSVIESKNSIRFEELSLTNLIETVSENIKTNYSHKIIKIEHNLSLETIKGDQRLMEQVISNLVDNACKYSGENTSVKITSFKKNNRGYIVIADNGPGISKEHLLRIFERFYRVDSSREASRGTGLGLSIVKHIITKHGGKIWAESEDSKGTTFIIELPIT